MLGAIVSEKVHDAVKPLVDGNALDSLFLEEPIDERVVELGP
jgi:hypothetical protein